MRPEERIGGAGAPPWSFVSDRPAARGDDVGTG
jgi:hypothetical protein